MTQPKRSHRLPHGEGSFYRRADGMWVGVLEAGWTDRGTRRRVTVSAVDEDAAWDKLRAARKRISLGQMVASTPTVKAWADTWLERQSEVLRPSPYRATRSYTRRWIVPTLGHKRLDALTPPDLRTLQQACRDGGLASSTAAKVIATMQLMCRDAITDGHPVRRELLDVRRPSAVAETRDAIPIDDAVRLVQHIATRPDAARWVAALLQGMRQAECTGLTWDAIDWDAETIDVSRQLVTLSYLDKKAGTFRLPDEYAVTPLIGAYHLAAPKTAAGVRTIPMVPWMRDALKEWRKRAPANPWGLVWTRETRRRITRTAPPLMPWSAAADLAAWYDLCDEAGVWKSPGERADDGSWTREPVRYVLHEARHTAASLLLSAGIDAEVVRQIMGWSDVAMRRVYQHADLALMRSALDASAKALALPASSPSE